MCGIVGFIGKTKNKEKIIKKMADRIKHRGPDGEGYYIYNDVALGHRRLSIIDIDNGKQPMMNDAEDIIVTYNGEIYNYPELRGELEKKGYKFRTNCDTEVLIHGYMEYGEEISKKLRGMFAFAIYDKRDDKLFCSRDPFGIKPFYYALFNKTFMFASEIKAFLEHPSFEKVFNKDILGAYLTFSFTPTTETFFKGVYRLNPGSNLVYQNGKVKIEKYYDFKFQENNKSFQENVEAISKVMHESVEKHLLSDVEVGSFLSSGIDSSYIVSLAKPNKTYTVGYDEARYNEIPYAKDLADKLNIDNIVYKIKKDEYLNIVPTVMYYMDEPFSDPASIALYFLSRMASKDVKVVLSGEGADEFFAGYNTYKDAVTLSLYSKVPYLFRHLVAKTLSPLPEFKGRNFLVRKGSKIEDTYTGINPLFSVQECNKVLAYKNPLTIRDIVEPVLREYQDKNDLVKMQLVDLNNWLVKDILHKADRMTMANSLELRVPFIDKEVFKLASSLSLNQKVTKDDTKIALREAAKKDIPNESYKKKKLGFPVPLRAWITEDSLYQEIKDTVMQDYVKEFFNQEYVIKLLDSCKKEKGDTYKKVWAIYTFLKWYQVFFRDDMAKVEG